MKIAIATDGDQVSAHFGRCSTYTLVDIEEGKVVERKVIENPEHSPGFLPGFLAEKGAQCVIAGGMGPRAQDLFAQNGIQSIIGVAGKIDDVIEQLIAKTLKTGESTCERDENDYGHGPGHGHGQGEAGCKRHGGGGGGGGN